MLRRTCTCRGGLQTCMVHTLWMKYLALLPYGSQPWVTINADYARGHLRSVLAKLGIQNAADYRTHDLRRGHAEVCTHRMLHCSLYFLLWLMVPGPQEIRLYLGRNPARRTVEVSRLYALLKRKRFSTGASAPSVMWRSFCAPIGRTQPLLQQSTAKRKNGLIDSCWFGTVPMAPHYSLMVPQDY